MDGMAKAEVDRIERSMIAAHAEDAIGHDDRTVACLRREPKRSLQFAHVEMFVDVLLDWSSEPDSIDDAVVIEFIADHRRLVGEHEMPPTQEIPFVEESREMLVQQLVLDELRLVLLLDRHKHANNVPQQVAAAFGDAVEEHRPLKRGLLELAVFLVQRVRFDSDANALHRADLRRGATLLKAQTIAT